MNGESPLKGGSHAGLPAMNTVPDPTLRLPAAGTGRVVALSRLRETLAADLVTQLEALVVNGWNTDDVTDAVATCTSWLHAQVAVAIDDGLNRWGRLP